MFGMFYNGPLSRKQYWLNLLAMYLCFIVVSLVVRAMVGEDDLVQIILSVAVWVGFLRLTSLRAIDVGYAKPGWMTAGCLLPLAGLFIWLTIGLLPWAQAQMQGARIA